MTITDRRRALMGVQGGGVVCPYITEGLIFWLDGFERGGISGKWKDLIGGKIFTLNNCTETADGVTFAGTTSSYGILSGPISLDCLNETLEVATDSVLFKNLCVLSQPMINDSVGISLICSTSYTELYPIVNGTQKYGYGAGNTGKTRVSVCDGWSVADGESLQRSTNTDSWGANKTGNTYIGVRGAATLSKPFAGKIHSIRIYNRKLSVAEMQANQAVDASRFNL